MSKCYPAQFECSFALCERHTKEEWEAGTKRSILKPINKMKGQYN